MNYPVIFLGMGLFTIFVSLYQTIAFRRLVRYVSRELKTKRELQVLPRVSVIAPCKGLDPGFEDNMRRLLHQDYLSPEGDAAFEVIFAVADKKDPAYGVLERVIAENKQLTVKLVVAGHNESRAQKVNNQLAALQQVSRDTEILVFADSDVIARNDFLRQLVAPLTDEEVGVSTGYRFYLPAKGNLASVLRSLWNRMSAWEMASPKFAFAWGGAMAVRRQVFQDAGIANCWDRSADDDLALTTAIRKLGKKVHFVPQCMVATDGSGSWAEVVEWMNRQLILTKVYFRPLWIKAVFRAALMAVWLLVFCAISWQCCMHPSVFSICLLALAAAILPIELLFLIVGQSLWNEVLYNNEKTIVERGFIDSCLAIPLGHVVLPWLTLYSLFTNQLSWRGVTYRLKAPDNVIVLRS